MHVDGFRFDLASIMTRGSRLLAELCLYTVYLYFYGYLSRYSSFSSFMDSLWDAVNVYGNPIEGDVLTTGSPLGNPPLIDMISNDPVLQGVKVFTLNTSLLLDCLLMDN